MTTTLDALLREVGTALFSAGFRIDLALQIEAVVGERLPRPEGPSTHADAEERRRAGMARVAEALAEAGRPMNAREIAAACWPNSSVAQVRGYLGCYLNRGWLDHGTPPPGSGQGRGYVLGVDDWRKPNTEANDLREQIRELEQKLAKMQAAGAAKGRR